VADIREKRAIKTLQDTRITREAQLVALELLTQGDDDAVERPDVLLLLVGSIVLAVNTKAPYHKQETPTLPGWRGGSGRV